MKITNLKVKSTKFTEDKKWADFLSFKIRLLQNSDWILLPDSLVENIGEWLEWRRAIKSVKRSTNVSPDQATNMLQSLLESMPSVRKSDEDWSVVKSRIINSIKNSVS